MSDACGSLLMCLAQSGDVYGSCGVWLAERVMLMVHYVTCGSLLMTLAQSSDVCGSCGSWLAEPSC